MKTLSRRQFLHHTAFSATVLAALPYTPWARAAGSNDAIRVGVVGFGGRGGDHIKAFRGLAGEGVRVTALCDCDSKILGAGVDSFAKDNQKVAAYTDIRKLLESPEIDAISVASPNHWHALSVVWACQAGKDVYVEKPVSHNVWEGRQAVNAARKYQRMVQAGTQSRSSRGLREAVQWVREGHLGRIRHARGLCYKPRQSIGKVEGPQPIPEEVDYDLWCGPAPKVPLHRKRLHYDWHWFWDTGNGDLGNQGIHQMDIARWFLGQDALSPAVFSIGERLGYDDDGQTPNTQFVFHDYPEAPLIFEVRGLPKNFAAQGANWGGSMDEYRGARIGVIVQCENGHILVPDGESAIAYDSSGKELRKWSGSDNHFANWIKAVRSRNPQDLNSEILEGHLSSALCHTGNISLRLGAHAPPAEIRERIRQQPEALETFERMAEHLRANQVDLDRDPLLVGEFLKMNPRREVFKDNRIANGHLRREYRRPFVVPGRV